MTLAVRVLAAHVLAGHVEDEEIALRRRTACGRELARRQAAAQIDGELQLVQRDARALMSADASRGARSPGVAASGGCSAGASDVANDPRGVAGDDRLGGTSCVTTEPAPTIARAPMRKPGSTTAPPPIDAPRPIIGLQHLGLILLASRILVVRKRRVRPDEHIVGDAKAVPELHAALDGDAVAERRRRSR